MPNIDTDLFQVLALALLFLSFISLLATLSVLNGIKKQLESGDAAGTLATSQTGSSYDYQAPAAAAYEPAATYGSTTPSYATEPPQTQEASTGFVSMADATPVAQTAASTAGTSLRGDEPEEQPFERDGRWWFKRGGELLVYDEGTGQWVASPSGASSATPAATSGAAGAVQTPVALRADTGEGWKCASCGAVNGSTATTCRMCFAPR
jgi:hypothetical protein